LLDANLALAFNAVIERAEFCRELLTDPPHDLADCGVRALSYHQRSWLSRLGLAVAVTPRRHNTTYACYRKTVIVRIGLSAPAAPCRLAPLHVKTESSVSDREKRSPGRGL